MVPSPVLKSDSHVLFLIFYVIYLLFNLSYFEICLILIYYSICMVLHLGVFVPVCVYISIYMNSSFTLSQTKLSLMSKIILLAIQ